MWIAVLLGCAGKGTAGQPPGGTDAAVHEEVGRAPLIAPNREAVFWPVVFEEDRVVGRLELEPGLRIPTHTDPVHERIEVLHGSGRVTLEGTEHPIGPGDRVEMPAGTEVAFRNEASRFVAWQTFEGTGARERFSAWTPIEPFGEPVRTWARTGPFVVGCGHGQCTAWYRGEPVEGQTHWSYGDADGFLQPLAAVIAARNGAWLVRRTAGDGCPVAYRAWCVDEEAQEVDASEPFGNCEAPERLEWVDGKVRLFFEGMDFEAHGIPAPNRPDMTVDLDVDTCEATVRTGEPGASQGHGGPGAEP